MLSFLVLSFIEFFPLLVQVLDELLVGVRSDFLLIELGNQEVLEDFEGVLEELDVLEGESVLEFVVFVLEPLVGHLFLPDFFLQEGFLPFQIFQLDVVLLLLVLF